jgi:hypothetical protein
MSDLKDCPICGDQFCPINSCDEDGEWDGSQKQNCDCDSYTYEKIDRLEKENKVLREIAEHYANEDNWDISPYPIDTPPDCDLWNEREDGFKFAQDKLKEIGK